MIMIALVFLFLANDSPSFQALVVHTLPARFCTDLLFLFFTEVMYVHDVDS